jgi:hypothetical protein
VKNVKRGASRHLHGLLVFTLAAVAKSRSAVTAHETVQVQQTHTEAEMESLHAIRIGECKELNRVFVQSN